MTQTDTNTRITGLGFYLDEIEKPIFCIFLENHRQTIDAMSASASVRAFLDRICLDNGRINYDEADRLLAKDEDCALLGKCLASALNHEFGEELLSCHYSSSTDINRPCLILLPEKVKDEPAIACVQKAANESYESPILYLMRRFYCRCSFSLLLYSKDHQTTQLP